MILCRNIGAAQLINRLDGKPFDENDERLFEVLYSIITMHHKDDDYDKDDDYQ